MAVIAQVQVVFWDQVYDFKVGDFKLDLGDQVVVKTEWGTEVGKVVCLQEISEPEFLKRQESLVPDMARTLGRTLML